MVTVEQLELQFITDTIGAKTGVILPIDKLHELMQDLEDLAAVAERREEPTLSHEELLAELKRDGLI